MTSILLLNTVLPHINENLFVAKVPGAPSNVTIIPQGPAIIYCEWGAAPAGSGVIKDYIFSYTQVGYSNSIVTASSSGRLHKVLLDLLPKHDLRGVCIVCPRAV